MREMYIDKGYLFHIIFTAVATVCILACLNILRHHSNACNQEHFSPMRVRCWTGAFFGLSGISQLYWLFIYYGPLTDHIFDRALLCTALDCVSSTPALLCTMLVLPQDRRRPLWPVFAAMALYLGYLLFIYVSGIKSTLYMTLPLLLIFIVFAMIMVRAVRQYDRWLLDNFADLEHKEVRTCICLLVIFTLGAIAYSLANENLFWELFIEVADIILIVTLTWRLETLQTLTTPAGDKANDEAGDEVATPRKDDLQPLLQVHCVDNHFYLQPDASLTQLARLIGTNRSYLSQYFAAQGMTYNMYINSLRIEHFIKLYREEQKTKRTIKAADLYDQCGFRNYRSFSNAFKQVQKKTFKEWVR